MLLDLLFVDLPLLEAYKLLARGTQHVGWADIVGALSADII